MESDSDDSNTVICNHDCSKKIHHTSTLKLDIVSPAQATLNKINQSFEEAKATQILQLLRDQETLNKIFIAKSNQEKVNSEENQVDVSNSVKSDSAETFKSHLPNKMNYNRDYGSRSKTAMGFNKDYDPVVSSDDENMNDKEPIVNTRVNRPKSSYVRRTSAVTENRTQHYQPSAADADVENPRRGSARPKSRLGRRPSDACRNNRQVLKETTNTTIPIDDNDGAQCVDDLIDVKDYDNYTNTTYEPITLKRQRSNVKLRQKEDDLSNMSTSGEYLSMPEQMNRNHNGHENVNDSNESPIMRHRRQQLRSARSNRPQQETLYISRQNTEFSGIERSPSNLSLRPKSEKILNDSRLVTRNYLSIDANPTQGSQLKSAYFDPKPTIAQTSDRMNYNTVVTQPSRPISRRGVLRGDLQGQRRSQTKNMSLYGSRPQPLGLMKLPPLDPSIPARTERSLVIAARETCA